MFDVYTVLKFLHVVAAILWLGAAFYTFITVRKGGEPAVRFLRITEPSASVLYPTTAVVIIVTGVWMTIDELSFGDPWIYLSLILFVVAAATGGGIMARNHSAIAKAANAGEPEESYAANLRQYLTVGQIDTVVLLAIVALMVFKPGV